MTSRTTNYTVSPSPGSLNIAWRAACLVAVGIAPIALAQNQERVREYRYAVIQVQGLGGGLDFAWGMNDHGHVVGQSLISDNSEFHPFAWDGKQTHDLGTFGGIDGRARDLNNRGWVVGFADSQNGTAHAFVWKAGGELIPLPELEGARFSTATSINDSNLIAGNSHTTGTVSGHACTWRNGKIRDLGTLDGPELSSIAFDVNEHGHATGWSGINQGGSFAFYWDGEGMVHIGSLGDGWQRAEPRGMNNLGDVVGEGHVNSNNTYHPFVYHDGEWSDLLRLVMDRGFETGSAHGINDNRQVVGRVWHNPTEQGYGFTFEQGEGMQILNDLIPPNSGWHIFRAASVNEHGQIGAWSDPIDAPHLTRSLLLTPIDAELDLQIPDGPLQADAVNTLTITGAQPGATIKFYYGKEGGGKFIPGCGALDAMTQINDPVRFGEATADANGVAVLDIFVPAHAAAHKGFLIQALDLANCNESQLVVKNVE